MPNNLYSICILDSNKTKSNNETWIFNTINSSKGHKGMMTVRWEIQVVSNNDVNWRDFN